MRKLILMIIGAILFTGTMGAQAGIMDVAIQPEIPSFDDDISLLISGVESSSVWVDDSFLTIDGTSLALDIYLELGHLMVVTPWSHLENIGILPIGTYDLTVNTLVNPNPAGNDTFSTSFEVVPEPVTALLFGLGMFFMRRKKT